MLSPELLKLKRETVTCQQRRGTIRVPYTGEGEDWYSPLKFRLKAENLQYRNGYKILYVC